MYVTTIANQPLSRLYCAYSYCPSFFFVSQAIARATATVTGNALGAQLPQEAAEAVRVGICLDFIYGVLAGSLLLFVLRPYWGSVFSTDAAVKDLGTARVIA